MDNTASNKRGRGLSRKGTSSFLLVSGGTGVDVEQNTARKKEDRDCDDNLDKDICDDDGAIQPLEDYGHVIRDNFTSFEEVRNKIKEQGIKKCNVIIAIDYTLSNITQGKKTNQDRCLHDLSMVNPYIEVINAVGETLEHMLGDNGIHVFGFGSKNTEGDFFPLHSEGPFSSFFDVIARYREVTPNVTFGGLTNFAPILNEGIDIVKTSKKFHILVIIADGQVIEEKETKEAIQRASNFPLSIIMIGVGDGPWGLMQEWDNRIKDRKFDNFQFVNFHNVVSTSQNPSAALALAILMEIPEQYKMMKELGMFPDT